jgi:hypothetical protein
MTWSDLLVRRPGLRDPVVFVDHATEHLPVPYWRVQRYDDRPVMIRWPLLPGLVRPMIVVATRGRTW